MSILFILGIVMAVIFSGAFINLHQSEQDEEKKEKNQHIISAVVMLAALALLASVIAVPILSEYFF